MTPEFPRVVKPSPRLVREDQGPLLEGGRGVAVAALVAVMAVGLSGKALQTPTRRSAAHGPSRGTMRTSSSLSLDDMAG